MESEQRSAGPSNRMVDNLSNRAALAAVDAVARASNLVEGAEAVARRAGLTNGKGEISRWRLARALFKPVQTTKKVLASTADELQDRAKRKRDG